MSKMMQEMFKVTKPVIAMAHFPALPGTPRYDSNLGIGGILEKMCKDINALLKGGVDGILFCNEDDRPYSLRGNIEGICTMTRVITELKPREIPFGVDYLWDAKAALAIAKATGAHFIREVITGVYESDMGILAPDPAEIFRYRKMIDAGNIKIFGNITPEFASPLGNRSVTQRVKSALVSSLLDAILISGPMAGAEPDLSLVIEAKEAVGKDVPVILNTGAKVDNISKFLKVADGVIVGSSLKKNGYTWNPVDPERVKYFMEVVRKVMGESN